MTCVYILFVICWIISLKIFISPSLKWRLKAVFSTTHGAINFKGKKLCKIAVICKYVKWKSYKKNFPQDLCLRIHLLVNVCLIAQLWSTLCDLVNRSPQPMGFSQQEYWSRLSFPPPGDFLIQGSNSSLLHCRWILYHWTTREAPPQLLLVKK